MYFSEDRSARMIFDQVSESYLDARPEYPNEIYGDLTSKIFEKSSSFLFDHTLEIGSGSGQASQTLNQLSTSLDCIEPGENFVKLLKVAFKDNNAVKIHQCTFEQYQTNQKYDLIFSGCALHWISKDIVFEKSNTLLKNGGWIVGVWNMPKFEPVIYQIIEKLIHPHYPDFDIPRGTQEQINYFDEGYQALKKQKWVKQIHKNIYYNKRSLDNEKLFNLIWSYMDITALGKENVELTIKNMKKEIKALGKNVHTVENCYPMAMAQKL